MRPLMPMVGRASGAEKRVDRARGAPDLSALERVAMAGDVPGRAIWVDSVLGG